jgi:alpha-tubulin suppressor-like RCC1 family protein
VQCWGDNLSGQLGDNSINFKLTPVLASDLSTYSLVVTGGYHTCGVTTGGTVKCWGNNQYGQVGDNSTWNRLVPTTVTGLPAGNVLWLTAGNAHTCAIVNTGGQRQVWCWGRGLYGQLGHNSLFDNWTPVRAGTISDAFQVSAGENHTCASTTSGAVWCWGRSGSGQLGYNSLSDSWVPVRVVDQTSTPIVAPFATIAAGRWHSCVAPIGPTQQAACWGDNTYGQLGNGSFLLNPRSQVLPSMTSVVSVTTGGAFSCAKLVDPITGNITKCWGANDSGQLGDGTLTNRDAPVRVGGACY